MGIDVLLLIGIDEGWRASSPMRSGKEIAVIENGNDISLSWLFNLDLIILYDLLP